PRSETRSARAAGARGRRRRPGGRAPPPRSARGARSRAGDATIVVRATGRARAASTPRAHSAPATAARRVSLDHDRLARVVARPREARERGRLAGEHPEGGARQHEPQEGIDRPVDGRLELETARGEARPRALAHGARAASAPPVEPAR